MRTRPTRRRSWARIAIVLGSCGLATCAGPAPVTCSSEHLATIRTVPAFGFLAVPVTIAGERATMLIDTGSQTSMLTEGWTAGRRLERDTHRSTDLIGAGGASVRVDDVLVSQLRLGNLSTGELSLPVGKLPGPLPDVQPPLAGLLGLDVLASYDLDIDRPRGTVDIYLRSGCDGTAPPWPGRATRVGLLGANDNLVLLPVRIDGQTLLAIVDTGARRTMLSAAAGRRLGLANPATSTAAVISTEGVDERSVDARLHRFADVEIGGHVFHDVRLAVSAADLPIGDLLLGEDFFRAHRFWFSPSTATAFIASGPAK